MSVSRRPQPVLDRAKVAAMATFVTGVLVAFLARRGVLLPDEVTDLVADLIAVGIVTGVGGLSTLWAAVRARAKVTPLDDPVNAGGEPLSPPAPEPDPADVAPTDDDPPAEHAELYPPTAPIRRVDIDALVREYGLD